MPYFWVTFENGSAGSICVASKDDAPAKAAEFGEVKEIKTLPYAATPMLGFKDCPFCYQPTRCAGRTACPTNPSCTS